WGMAMGPVRLIDEIGVDITIDIGNTLEKAYGQRDHVPSLLLWLRDQQMLGRKTGAGFYKYEGRMQGPNESLVEWRRAHVVASGAGPGRDKGSETTKPVSPPPATAEELTHRLIFLIVNEAARCVQERVVDSPQDADYGMILGTGFAPFRGGPLRFAEDFGLKRIVEELERLARTEEKFTPCEILRKHARDGTKFYEE